MKTRTNTNGNRKMYVAYYRVSTKKQGLGLEAQRTIAQQYTTANEGEIVSEYSEKESAKGSNNNNRKELYKAMQECKRTGATLLIAKLDRLSRDVEFIAHLQNDSSINFCACDLPEFNTLTLYIFAALAQHERELISSRTKAALRVKKEKGAKLGAHNGVSHIYGKEDRVKAAEAKRENAKENENSRKAWHFAEYRILCGVTYKTIADELNSEHYPTPKGSGVWRGNMVKRLEARFKN